MQSIIQKEKCCYVCRTQSGLHDHHIFFGSSNRKNSERHGLKVWLCGYHHNMSSAGVHFNRALDLELKQLAQSEFEKTHSRAVFRKIFGKSWL